MTRSRLMGCAVGLIRRAMIATVALGLACAPARAQAVTHVRLDRSDLSYDVRPDLSYVETATFDYTLLTQRGLDARERSQFTFHPGTQSLEVVEAWVDQPDGTRVMVTDANRFTRPSEAAQGAPGFTGSLTTTVLYPQLRVGSRTHIKWRMTQRRPTVMGFNVWAEPPFEWPLTLGTVEIAAPAGLDLHWRARGGYEVSDTITAGVRRIEARLSGHPGEPPERDMVATSDFQPLFLASTLSGWKEIGAIYARQEQGHMAVTPEIAALAARIADGRTGLDAARRVYDWVAANIRYVAVYLDPNDGYVPHDAAEVLRQGYGDCKDHAVLMQALLASLGVRAEAALVDWGRRMRDLPLWQPGQFNHAIVYLPDYDRYANPTNPYARFDALDQTLADKLVVIATPQGRVARTPAVTPDQNAYRDDSRMALAADGTVTGTAVLSMSPSQEIGLRGAVAATPSPRDLAERLLRGTAEGGTGEILAGNPMDLAQGFPVTATWRSPHGVTFENGLVYMAVPAGPDLQPPRLLRRYLAPGAVRRHALLAEAGDYSWTSRIALPPGLVAERLPDDQDIRTSAGSYTSVYRYEGRDVVAERHLVIAHAVQPAGDQAAFERLVYAPLDDSRAVMVLGPSKTAARQEALAR
jgi:transglutaminase-like putative cysteine protease